MELLLLSLGRLAFYNELFAKIIFLLTREIKNEDNYLRGRGQGHNLGGGGGGRGQRQTRCIMRDVEMTNGPTTDSYLQL